MSIFGHMLQPACQLSASSKVPQHFTTLISRANSTYIPVACMSYGFIRRLNKTMKPRRNVGHVTGVLVFGVPYFLAYLFLAIVGEHIWIKRYIYWFEGWGTKIHIEISLESSEKGGRKRQQLPAARAGFGSPGASKAAASTQASIAPKIRN